MAKYGISVNLHLTTQAEARVSDTQCGRSRTSTDHWYLVIWKHAGRDASTSYNAIHAPSVLSTNLDPSKLKGTVDKRTITDEWVKPPPSTTPELKLEEKPTLDSVVNADDFEHIAQNTASKKTWAFYSSADTDCLTRDRNKEYFGRVQWRPRLLRNVRNVSTKTQMLGHDVGMPLFVSPAASESIPSTMVCSILELIVCSGKDDASRR